MHFVFSLVVSIFMAVTSTVSLAAINCDKVEPAFKAADVKAPMRFYVAAHPCTGNAVNWPYMAVGAITEDTPKLFAEFTKKNDPSTPIEFVSPGGNLLAALKLGEMVRKAGYDTSLGELCASACAYAIMGGVKRYIAQKTFNLDSDYDNRFIGASGTKLGIHQFYRSDSLSEPQIKAFSAIDKSADQMLMGILVEYTLRMGIDTRLVSAASIIPPWEDLRWLTQEEMVAWNVDNTLRRYSNLVFYPFGRFGSYVETSNVRGPDVSYLRMFCQNKVKEPLFAFITDFNAQATSSELSQIKMATDYIKGILGSLALALEFGSGKPTISAFRVDDVQGAVQAKNTVRVSSVIRAIGLAREDAVSLARVSLSDNGNLARSEWTFQDNVKFKIQGDRRLIRLAMKNCVD